MLKKLIKGKINIDALSKLNDSDINLNELEKSLEILKDSKEDKTIYNSKVRHFWDAFIIDNKYSDSYENKSIPKVFITTGYLRGYGINGYNQTFHAPKRLEQIARDWGVEFHLVGSLQNKRLWENKNPMIDSIEGNKKIL